MHSCDYKVESISFEDAKAQWSQYEYALIYRYSDAELCQVTQLADDASYWDECVEAYIFSKQVQIHIYREDNTLMAAKCVESSGENYEYVDRSYPVSKQRWNVGLVTVREYLDADEDGQAYVSYKRLLCVTKGEGEVNG